MPIPTDTFWNIKKLNVVFALSAVATVAVTMWAVVQDHEKDWRLTQNSARVWESAMTRDKIQSALTPEEKQTLADLEKQIAAKEAGLASGNEAYRAMLAKRKGLESERATLEFRLNNLKSNVQVDESQLQDAITADDKAAIARLTQGLQGPREQLAKWNEDLAAQNKQISDLRKEIDAQTLQIDEMKVQKAKIASESESLRKRAVALDPREQGGLKGVAGAISSQMRDAPLLGFVNPAQRVQQIVLPDVQTDVAFMKITTVDRCTTCHVNIANRDFAEEKVLAFLEEQMARVRELNLPKTAPTGATAPTATADKPGPAAAIDFWHYWALKIAPAPVLQRNNGRINLIMNSIGAAATITYDGQPAERFAYARDATDPAQIRKQNEVLMALMEAYARATPETDSVGKRGKAIATISKSANVTNLRNQSLRYPEDLRNGLQASLSADDWGLLEDRYRYALVDELNAARKTQGLPALDASPVLLAHPDLELYVDVDSPHGMESVGCTSCHDGSGQETDFVLAAHMARDIYVDSRTGVPVLGGQMSHPPEAHHDRHDLSSMLAAVYPEDANVPEPIAHLRFSHAPSTQPAESGGHGESRPIAYVDPATGREGQAVTQFDYWKHIYEPKAPRNFALVYHEWDWPMRTPEYIQANCARCHTEVYDIKDTAPVLYQGRQLFTQMGCVNCHQMDSIPATQNRKVGTDLRQVSAKLSPQFVNTWIWAPKAFRPTTKMPHFFMLENNSSDEELRRTRQEARAVTEFLFRTATPQPPKHEWPSSGQGNAQAGKALFSTIGCLGCHQNLNERGESWITTDLVKRAGMAEDAAKAAYTAMGYNQRQMYVQQHLAEPTTVNTAPKYSDGTAKPTFIQVGPELSGIGTKLASGRSPEQARAWLFDWLSEPQHYSSYTFMPRLRLSEQQAMDLAEYLLAQKRTTADPADKWQAGLTPVDSDKLIELTALQLKSRFSALTARQKADENDELTSLATAALTTPFKTEEQAKAEAEKMSKDERRLVFLGQKLIAHYGCMSCHAINGMETVSSPCANLSDWGQKGVDKLDYGYLDHHKAESLPKVSGVPLVNGLSVEAGNLVHEDIKGKKIAESVEVAWPEVGHDRHSWITQKLKNTRAYDRGKVLLDASESDPAGKPYDKLKMPTFYLNDEQVHAIVTFVLSNRYKVAGDGRPERLVSEKLVLKATNEQATLIARGRELTERYNCISCHQTERNSPQIQQYFGIEDITTKAPPSLRGEGNKIQYSWLFNFFKHVEPLRPLIHDGIRMPSFPLVDAEWTAIVAYFNSISNKESRDLGKRVDPIDKYIAAQASATTRPAAAEPTETWPGDDWWQRPEFASALAYLRQWGLDYGHIKPIEVAPSSTADELRKVYANLLFKANFTRELYAAPYPFVDSPRPQLSDARFKLGEKFFYELQCLKCHVLGDPNVAGANKTPTAPNLSLTYLRLQQRWVRHWVQDPNIIQIGTAMPPFFTGQKDKDQKLILKLDGLSWPRVQGTERPTDAIEAEYGATVGEQTSLLLDFLYAAGARGTTGIQPPGSTTAPAADAR